MGSSRGRWPGRCGFAALVGFVVSLIPALEAADIPRPEDDATYRPTVMIRRGKSLGTGTIIASTEGETLVLTASHVVADPGAVFVELFRYNLGVERVRTISGFPRKLEAFVVARDADADVAILRIDGQLAFPYVAGIARGDSAPAIGTKVTTIGFDKGARLIGFSTRVRSVGRIDLDHGGGFRSFLVTDDPPEVGRSGGGLFRADGALVGVCVGRMELGEGRISGLFSTLGNVRELIRGDDAIASSMARATVKARSPAR
jgi:S1-C subfamily serine protease